MTGERKMDYVGPMAGLGAAACWAMASVLYARVPLGAGAMTTFKNSLATVCMLVLLVITKLSSGDQVFEATTDTWKDISLSGIVGLCLADIAYFRSIQILGARRGLTLTLLTPPATALLGDVWLGDRLPPITWLFILITLVGIGIVMRQNSDRNPDQDIRPGSTRWGVISALLGIATMAIGAVILKRGLTDVGPIEGTFIRLLAASVFGCFVSWPLGQFREIAELLTNRKGTVTLCAATALGTVTGVVLMLAAYKYCPTGIAATLTSTSPLFVIPVVAVVYREKITALSVLGATVAFAGVCGLILA